MKINEQKTIKGTQGTNHYFIKFTAHELDWIVMINENSIKKVSEVHLLDESSKKWRSFDGRSYEESNVYSSIKKMELIKLKYEVK